MTMLQRLKCLIFKSMSTGQNWTSHFFNAADEQGSGSGVTSWLEGGGGIGL